MASMMDLRRNIALNEPHVVDDVQTTNIATFTTDMKAPIKSIRTYFKPIQAGSGTPSPDNVRSISGWNDIQMVKCGKNLFNAKAQRSQCFPTVTGNTTTRHYIPNTINPGASATNFLNTSNLMSYSVSDNSVTVNCKSGYGLGYAFCLTPGETYTLSGLCDSEYPSIGIAFYTIDDVFIKYRENVQFPYTFTVNDNAYITLITFKSIGSGYSTDITYSNIQLEKGSVATNYEPYNGELFLTPSAEYAISPGVTTNYGVTWTVNSDGTIDYEGTPTSYASVVPGIYYVRDPNEKIKVAIYGDVDNVVFNALQIKDANNTVLDSVYEGYRHADIDFSQYENPYSIRISLKRSYNDVYMKGRCWVRITSSLDEKQCGYIDWINGETVVTHRLITITGSESNGLWNLDSYCFSDQNEPLLVSNNNSYQNILVCSHTGSIVSGGDVWVTSSGQGGSGRDICAALSQGRNVRYRDRNNMSDLATAQAYLQGQYNNGTPVQMVCKIETPVHYSITPQQLKTFVGTNNIYSSANGNTEIEYYTH